jgi:alanine racemase
LSFRPTYAGISLPAVTDNIRLLRSRLRPSTLFMAVVKSDAYGHGDLEVSRTALAAGASRLGVALVEEAERLREAGISAPIHLLFEPPPQAAARVVELDLVPTVYSRAYAEELSRSAQRAGRIVPVHLKLDTGMHRVGMDPASCVDEAAHIGGLPSLEMEGVYTHFALASDPDSPFNRAQMEVFLEAVEKLERAGHSFALKHAAASGAILCLPEAELDMVRAGIAIYGLYPGPAFEGMVDLNPALALKTSLSHVFRAGAGEGISYGLTCRVERDSWIGVIPIGYGDGLQRRLSNRMQVLIGGKRYRQAGTICMDLTMIDLGGDAREPGEEVVLIGPSGGDGIRAEEMAALADTINYEIVCGLSKRTPRIYE